MLFTLSLIFSAVLLPSAVATPTKAGHAPAVTPAAATLAQRDCTHDNCLRAIIASAFLSRSATADCSSYFLTTITPATYTSTVTVATVTSLVDMKKRDEGMLLPRQQTVIPASIPSYASACSGSVRYSSACSCIGVTAQTTFAPTPTYIETVTATTTVVSPPTLPALQYSNADDCTDGQPLTTTFTLNTCVTFPVDLSLSFGTFIGGACSPDQCSVLLYDYSAVNCGTTPAKTLPVTDSSCIDISTIFSGQLVCPTCPQS